LSDYIQSTNFATKDALPSGDPLKIVKGTEINTEFANIAIAVATKADLASPTFTGTPTLPSGTIATTQSSSDSSTKLATTAFVQAVSTALGALKADKTTTVTAGTGLSGGGDLSANRTLSIANTGVSSGSYGSGTAIPVIAVNSQGQLTSASTASLTLAEIGVGQTWQDVTSSRSSGTNYTNSTSKPIMVSVYSSGIDSSFSLTVVVDGVTVSYAQGGGGGDARRTGNASFIVPASSTYSATYSGGALGTSLRWAELR
jgi:hypothetical protein